MVDFMHAKTENATLNNAKQFILDLSQCVAENSS